MMPRILPPFTCHIPCACLLLALLTGCHLLPGSHVKGEDSQTAHQNKPTKAAPRSEADVLQTDAEQAEKEGRYLAALDAWLARVPLLMDDSDLRANSRHVWEVLCRMPNEDFVQLMRREHSQLLDGWVSLAHIQRFGASDLEQQANQLQDWQRQWPLHPANRYLPEDMKLLKRLKEEQPRHIALLLPLSGKRAAAGQAVRDGFLAAYYQDLAHGGVPVRIDVVDSEASPDLLASFGQAVANGAQVVIGPLERGQVQVLAAEPALAVPVLALNEVPRATTPSTLYQFSLNPEEEARQAAITASGAGWRRALVISSDQERGDRLAQSFTSQWQAQGGTVLAQARYHPQHNDYDSVISQALATAPPASPDNQHGIDVVFLASKATEASQIMPVLAAHNADQLPVYGTSQLYDPQSSLRGNDLDGVHLGLTPWQAGQGAVTGTITQSSPPAAGYELLYALGADAQDLYLRLAMMQANAGLTLSGHTGFLRMNPQRHIERGMVWTVLQGGQPAPVSDTPTVPGL